MSTLPFLLSVADELDNLNSQSYMDDFGLGFHPHRQYYRTPTIQLSLPASTDWMEHDRSQRYRSHKFVFETQNNLTATAEGDEAEGTDEAGNGGRGGALDGSGTDNAYVDRYGSGASTSAASRQKYTSLLNSNNDGEGKGVLGGSGSGSGSSSTKGGKRDDADAIDNTVQMYNLSKKCCKNYYRRGDEPQSGVLTAKEKSAEGGYRLHAKCMEGANSSSDESLQKPTSSIEFLTCFLLKKSRAPKGAGISGGKKSS
ncbi:PREDICTED: uncharacterized protein LOC108370811 [Rhagoletis zephyria]|uniref:uncharacterized protein LOC108370811 n=1 Tax=Rhagoletis zephyria TaxID=28612 RepID=UPI0008114750|nr:PREDICTED: uncharacterized protein LOC108370811 [Rhagoletis zephyria]XP_036341104.1 uncharacterized protein LOC118750500 [Rhagoletis pomonella]XP_036341565.1 uncharacterized protein LOC118750926 [Rhagoletis pomonella]XP_036341587.1 uncharacterized protein LOC118750942 [Rhagoletis pomonella]